MRLWLLRPYAEGQGSWDPWDDKAFGFVVAAPDEEIARNLAASDAGDEGSNAWLDDAQSMCIELEAAGECRIIIRDFAHA